MTTPHHVTEADWHRQEAAWALPATAPLRAVLASPPPLALPPDFALCVATLAEQRARTPSVWVERGLSLTAVLLLLLAAAVATHWQPALWAFLGSLLDTSVWPDAARWWPLVAVALLAVAAVSKTGARTAPLNTPKGTL